MRSKKITRMLAPISGIMSFMLVMGVMATPVWAEETKTDNVISDESVKNDYATYINSTVEKSGFKLTLNKVTATKNKMIVTTTIKCPEAIDDDTLGNSIFSLTVKKSDCESFRGETRKLDDKTLEVDFNVNNFNGFPESADLRFDIIIPKYNFNGWVNASVNLAKNYDKIFEKDILINNDKAGRTYNKFESDVLGTTIYCKEAEHDDTDYEEKYSDHDSKMLIKCDDKLYAFDRSCYFGDDYRSAAFTCNNITYDDINKAESVTLIPVICTLKNKDIDQIYSDFTREEIKRENTDNVQYEKEFKFSDGKNGEISKIERKDNKVKVYCSSDSEKKSLLMAIGIDGWCSSDDDIGYLGKPIKVIYKNPDNANGYIVEFENVDKNVVFRIDNNDRILGHSDNFEFEQETKIK